MLSETGFASVCPVFTSKFRILRDCDGKESGGESPVLESTDASNVPCDEDGDLEVVRRPRCSSSNRDAVCPIILSQSAATLTDEEEDSDEEDGARDVIKIGEGCIRDVCELMDLFCHIE